MLHDLTRMQAGQQLGCRGRALRLAITARHPSKATQHRQTGPGAKKTAKKRGEHSCGSPWFCVCVCGLNPQAVRTTNSLLTGEGGTPQTAHLAHSPA